MAAIVPRLPERGAGEVEMSELVWGVVAQAGGAPAGWWSGRFEVDFVWVSVVVGVCVLAGAAFLVRRALPPRP